MRGGYLIFYNSGYDNCGTDPITIYVLFWNKIYASKNCNNFKSFPLLLNCIPKNTAICIVNMNLFHILKISKKEKYEFEDGMVFFEK